MPSQDPRFLLEPLSGHHDRPGFTCGVESLDQYLRTQASQDMRRRANAVFMLTLRETPSTIAGYFTLCACGLAPGSIPEAARRHLPRYPQVSATLIGRLAIASRFQGAGLGSMLLAQAIRKAYDNSSIVGSCMIVVDALDERAASFYQAHGFLRLPDSLRLLLPLRTAKDLVE